MKTKELKKKKLTKIGKGQENGISKKYKELLKEPVGKTMLRSLKKTGETLYNEDDGMKECF